MAMTNKLLSDEEIIYQLEQYQIQAASEYRSFEWAQNKLLDLINAQKRLYAEMVIGEHNATYNNELDINDANYGAVWVAVSDTVNGLKNNPSNESQIRYTKYLTERAIEHASKGIAAKAEYELIKKQRARIK